MSKRLPIDKLSPAAARMLLALLTVEPDEQYDEAVIRSGISGCLTFLTARQQLVKLGFIVQRDGREFTTVYEQEPAEQHVTEPHPTIPYPGTITKISKAVQ